LQSLCGEQKELVVDPRKHIKDVFVSGTNRNGMERFHSVSLFLCSFLGWSGMRWNGVVPEKGIFLQYAEPTGPADSAGRGGTAQ
jgi:hypothetical protein